MNAVSGESTRSSFLSQASRIVVGQEAALEHLLISLLAEGHVLLEGVPGTGKTLMAKTLALLVDTEFSRVQFTPDLMPADIIGTSVFDLPTSRFNLHKGPIFTNILLADEINRAPAKTQAALLEAMEERQVTLEGARYPLGQPFMVIATQNPVEYEGTYPLPEAQVDRFFFKVLVDYPPADMEKAVLQRYHEGFQAQRLEDLKIEPVLDPQALVAAREECRSVTLNDGIMDYISAIVRGSRQLPEVLLGASPRAGIGLLLASKAAAWLDGRSYVLPDDVKRLAPPVLRHRLLLRPETEVQGVTADVVVQNLLASVPVPR
jgi:MoxR-like ATPase